jgi:hypothetical protein
MISELGGNTGIYAGEAKFTDPKPLVSRPTIRRV